MKSIIQTREYNSNALMRGGSSEPGALRRTKYVWEPLRKNELLNMVTGFVDGVKLENSRSLLLKMSNVLRAPFVPTSAKWKTGSNCMLLLSRFVSAFMEMLSQEKFFSNVEAFRRMAEGTEK